MATPFLVTLLAACAGVDTASIGEDQTPAQYLAPGVVGRYLAGKFAEDSHDFPGASAQLEQALAVDPDNTELMIRVAVCLAAEGRLPAAAAVSRRLLVSDPNTFLAAFVIAEQRAKAQDWAGVREAVAGQPHRGVTQLMVPLIDAWAKMGANDTDGALDSLKGLQAVPALAPVYQFHVALVNDLADRQAAAAQAYDATLALPGGTTLRTTEAAALFFRRIGQADKASAILRRYPGQHPDLIFGSEPDGVRAVASAADGLAEAFFGTAESIRPGNAPELTLAFDRLALDLRPDFPLAQFLLGETMESASKLPLADEAYNGIRRTSPTYWVAQMRVSSNLDELDQADAALAVMTEVSAHFPQRAEPLIAAGDLLERHEKWSEAIAAYDRAAAVQTAKDTNPWYVFYARGIAKERDHQWPSAEADFLHALELQPNAPEVLNYLGYSWIEQGTNLDKARKMIDQALAQRPDDGAYVDSKGWAQYHMGEFAPAVETLEHAVELTPYDATINDHLGDALWRVGREDEARFQWHHALLYSPEPALQDAIEKKLTTGLKPAASSGPRSNNRAQ